MKFVIDAQLPPILARWLREQGHGAEHVEDIGLRDADDNQVWIHALSVGATLITKDEDFADRSARELQAPVIVWLRVGYYESRTSGMDATSLARSHVRAVRVYRPEIRPR